MARYDDMNTQNMTVVGLCGAVGTFVIILGLQVMYYDFESAESARKAFADVKSSPESILNEQRSRLATYGWIDHDQQIVSIPIEEAMSVVLKREQQAVTKGMVNEIR